MISTIPPANQKIDVFLQWCSENAIWLDPRLCIHMDSVGIGVYSRKFIPSLSSVVHIHKNSVLSVRSCALSEYITPILYGPEAQYALSLALYVEILVGKVSRWFGYLQSLPQEIVDLPIFWNQQVASDSCDDGNEALAWLRGTEVERQMKKTDLNSLRDYYYDFAEPLLLRYLEQHDNFLNSKPNLQGFYRAYSLVSSRAFLVDSYHGLSMVPVADVFNHEQDNHVHLQTEFTVCPECGSLYECPHDQELNASYSRPTKYLPPISRNNISLHTEKDLDQYYEMVCNTPIQPHTEVFNTYGETLTNAQLLTQYGFTLDVNENDCITWDPYEVYQSLVSRADGDDDEMRRLLAVWTDVLQKTAQSQMFELVDSELIYFYPQGADRDLCLNGDGKISHQLWVLLALSFCLRGQKDWNTISILMTLKNLLAYQVDLESGAIRNEMGATPGREAVVTTALVIHMSDLACSVTDLCISRKNLLGKEGIGLVTHGELSDMLDTIPEEMVRARLAVSVVMSERSILDSCISGWMDMQTNAV